MTYTAGTTEGDAIELLDAHGRVIPASSYNDVTGEAEIIVCNSEGRAVIVEGPDGENEILTTKVKVPGAQIRLKKSRSGAI